MEGRVISHYKVLKTLGQGGMGVVYVAEDTKLRRKVALKFLSGELAYDRHACDRFLIEARAASALNHPNICTLYEIGEVDEGPFIAMEFIEGRTLEQLINGKPLKTDTIIRLGIQIADALDAAHAKGIIHRDIKATNVMVTSRGEAKVMDFGLAKFATRPNDIEIAETSTASLTASGCLVGTWAYMSPEQARGEELDTRTDLFSLGTLLYQAATGQLPFPGDTALTKLDAILNRAPCAPVRLNPELPVELERIITKALEKDRDLRYQTAAELQADLKRLQRNTGDARMELPARRDGAAQYVSRRQLARAGAIVGVAVVLAAAGIATFYRTTPIAPVRAVAVLPLENLSGDPEQEYFADGMTEQLTTDLSSITTLRVISRTSVMQYKKARKPLSDIARELGVDAVIEGSVVRVGDSVRITAKLIRAGTEDTLWARSYERDLRDVLALQREVARSIASQVDITLTPQEQARLASARAVDPEAHRLVLLGRFHLEKLTEESIKKGIEYFELAIAKDRGDAMAYVGLADAYTNLANWYVPPRETMPKAKTAALTALKLDESLADAHAALGLIYLTYDWDGPSAEREFRRAIQLNPSLSAAHLNYAGYLLTAERPEEALQELRRAVQLDPLSAKTHAIAAVNSIFARRFDEALQLADKALELEPNFALALAFRGLALAELGRYEEALSSIQKAGQPDNNTTIRAFRAHVHAVAGNKDEARRIMQKVEADAKQRYFCAYEVATSYVSLGDMDTADKWFRKGIEERADCMAWLGVEPWVEPFRSDPRYAKLLRDVGLAPSAKQR